MTSVIWDLTISKEDTSDIVPPKTLTALLNSLCQLVSVMVYRMCHTVALLEAYVNIGWSRCFRYQTCLASITVAIMCTGDKKCG